MATEWKVPEPLKTPDVLTTESIQEGVQGSILVNGAEVKVYDETGVKSEIALLRGQVTDSYTLIDSKSDKADLANVATKDEVSAVSSQLAENTKQIDTTVQKTVMDKFHKILSDASEGSVQATYIIVGDSTRASNGAWIHKYVSEFLSRYNVTTYLSAQSGLKAEHWSKYTPNLQPGYPTVDNVIALIPGTGTNTMVDICLGINDAFSKTATETETYIKAGIDLIKASKPDVIVNITSPNRLSDSAVVDKLKTVYKNLSESYGYGFINVLDNVFKEWNAGIKADYFVDDTHPNELGQRKMAEYIVSKLGLNYKGSNGQGSTKKTTLTTGIIAPNKFKKIATVTINQQYYGFYGTFIARAVPGNELKNSTAVIDISITQSAALGSDASKSAEITITNNGAIAFDFFKTSIVLRTRICDATKTVIDIYIKNITTGNRNYELFILSGVNTSGTQVTYSIGNDLTEYTAMDTQAAGTTDVNGVFTPAKYLGSPDGSLWAITVNDSGVITATKKA